MKEQGGEGTVELTPKEELPRRTPRPAVLVEGMSWTLMHHGRLTTQKSENKIAPKHLLSKFFLQKPP